MLTDSKGEFWSKLVIAPKLAVPSLLTKCITLEQALNPPHESFVVGSLFPFGKASVLWGAQGAGKSIFLSQLAFSVASSAATNGPSIFLGMFINPRNCGPVLVYSAEDTFEDWQRKAGAYCKAFVMEQEHERFGRALQHVHIIDKSEGIARLSEIIHLRAQGRNYGEMLTRVEPRPTQNGTSFAVRRSGYPPD